MNYMQEAIKESQQGMRKGDGGPFGAVIVKGGKIVGRGHNCVLGCNDPTAHAEVVAIRDAAKKLNSYDLSGCEIYSSCEPCPMCYSAIHWARIDKLYYAATRQDAAAVGFDDDLLYQILAGKKTDEQLSVEQIDRAQAQAVFEAFKNKSDRIIY